MTDEIEEEGWMCEGCGCPNYTDTPHYRVCKGCGLTWNLPIPDLGLPEPHKAEGAPQQKDGIALIAAERQRQISEEGWTSEHDDAHESGEMAQAAATYAIQPGFRVMVIHRVRNWLWPWDLKWFKPTNRIRDLEKAGALIAAEIDRLLRKEASPRQLSLSEENKQTDVTP